MDILIQTYLSQLESLNYSPNTLDTYARYLPYLNSLALKKFDTPIYKLKASELILLKNSDLKLYSPATQNLFFGMLKGLQSYLIADGKIDYISVTNHLYNKIDASYSKAFSIDDIKNMRTVAKTNFAYISFLLLCMSGLRISELVALRVTDIDRQQESIWIRKSKNHNGRRVLFTPLPYLTQVWKYLDSIEIIEGEPLIFSTAKSEVRTLIDDFNTKYHTNFYTHNTRSTYATLMLDLGYRLDQIMRYLGHKNLATTLKYIDSRRNYGFD